jgi:polycomb protein EED
MRFSLFHYPGRRPILVIGNEKSKVFFWDLQALEEWDATAPRIPQTDGNYEVPSRAAKRVIAHKSSGLRQGSYDSETTGTTGTGPAEGEVIGEGDPQAKEKFAVDDPFRVLLPHKVHVVPRVSFAARQTSWSVGGEWMVLVGDEGMIVLFGRKELK